MSYSNTIISGSKSKLVLAAAALAAAIHLTGSAASAAAITAVPGVTSGINNVTSITTKTTAGTPATVNNVAGVGTGYSVFPTGNKYNVTYGGAVESVQSITAGGTTYSQLGLASNVIDRFIGPNNDTLWFNGSFTQPTTSGTTTANGNVAVAGPNVGGFSSAFLSNNINLGADNLFSTKATAGNPVGNNTNVDRVDLLFKSGITTTAAQSFLIADRGDSTDHDAFDVAAITSLDANGNPASYGPLLQFADGTWGTTVISPAQQDVILRKNNSIPGDTLHPSDYTNQGIGGVAITTAGLDGGVAGTTIYGYSLFGPNVTITGDGSGTQLVNFQDASVYGLNDSTSTGGGLDPAATLAVLYQTTTVPEPTTAALATTAVSSLLLSRRRKGASRRGA